MRNNKIHVCGDSYLVITFPIFLRLEELITTNRQCSVKDISQLAILKPTMNSEWRELARKPVRCKIHT